MGEADITVARRLRSAGDEIACTGRVAREGTRAYGGSLVGAALRTRRIRRRGYEWAEMAALGLLDPSLGSQPAGHLVGTGELRRARARINPPQMVSLTRDRAVLYRLLEAAGVPIPALYGLIGATTGWTRGGRIVAGPEAFARFLADEVPEDFVVAPCLRGPGTRVLHRSDGRITDAAGTHLTPAALLAAATAVPSCDLAIVQERLTNHAALEPLGGTELRTARIVTLVRPDCSVDVLAAVMRLPDEPADDGAGAGPLQVLAEIDPADGRLSAAFAWRRGRSRASERTPPDVTLPNWDEALDLVRRTAPLLLPLRTAAWEIAPTPAGPVLLDADADYRPWHSPGCRRVADALAGAA